MDCGYNIKSIVWIDMLADLWMHITFIICHIDFGSITLGGAGYGCWTHGSMEKSGNWRLSYATYVQTRGIREKIFARVSGLHALGVPAAVGRSVAGRQRLGRYLQ
jgi:hypothetical protein